MELFKHASTHTHTHRASAFLHMPIVGKLKTETQVTFEWIFILKKPVATGKVIY